MRIYILFYMFFSNLWVSRSKVISKLRLELNTGINVIRTLNPISPKHSKLKSKCILQQCIESRYYWNNTIKTIAVVFILVLRNHQTTMILCWPCANWLVDYWQASKKIFSCTGKPDKLHASKRRILLLLTLLLLS